ncbi:MAG TPA: HDOD domain-containing protein [Kofleriaceae bacterium]|jgi:HD-like signal output (HDOD) protein
MTATGRWRVLFVDDDPTILQSFKLVFHRERATWDVVCALGGDAALTEMRVAPFDVVVSDMRMPTIDGAELLAIVKAEWPATFRIILSGDTPTAMLRAMSASHVILGKPCDRDTLRTAIVRAHDVARAAGSPGVRALLGRIDKLPSPPRTYLELTELVANPRSGLDDVAAVVARDTALAAKVMQLASSAAFGRRGAMSLRAAVGLLGFELLRGIALTTTLFAPGKPGLEEMQETALRAAAIARDLAPPALRDLAFVAALLHDVGRIVLAGLDERSAVLAAELAIDPAQLGAHLLGMWGLPCEIVEAIACYQAPETAAPSIQPLAATIHAAVAQATATAVGRVA